LSAGPNRTPKCRGKSKAAEILNCPKEDTHSAQSVLSAPRAPEQGFIHRGTRMPEITPGLTHEMSMAVTPDRTAKHLATGTASVLSTPSMVWLVEHAAQVLAQMHLPAGQTTVGAEVSVRHLAPTPLGMRVTAKVRVDEVDGRRIVFSAEVFDEKEKVGEGRHVRVIVDEKHFAEKVAAKSPDRP
jgi:fluoroacetyl-CoA thioesterase